ncbi:MAG: C45 family autoproteolytic acyltransferase/hydrolase [Myxococcota bacterium]|nr:C45 family autoproteolytic acyltransferase/hydrolase [Myxococcota bacterium]
MATRLREYDAVRGDVIDVDLEAPPAERWRTALQGYGDEIADFVGDVRQLIPDLVAQLGAPWDTLIGGLLQHSSKIGLGVGLIGKAYGQQYVDEIKGVAQAAEQPVGDMLLAGLTYDIAQVSGKLLGACSSFSCNIEGTPVLARNLDWALPESVGKHTVLTRFHRGRQSYLSVHVLGTVGVLSVMAKGRWAATINQAPASKLGFQPVGVPAMIRLRQCADLMLPFGKMVEEVQRLQTISPFFVHLVGAGPNQHLQISGLGKTFATRKREGEFLIQTNHHADPELKRYNDPEDADDSHDRYKALERRLKALPETIDEALLKLARQPVTHGATMQAMVLHPACGEWRLRVRV